MGILEQVDRQTSYFLESLRLCVEKMGRGDINVDSKLYQTISRELLDIDADISIVKASLPEVVNEDKVVGEIVSNNFVGIKFSYRLLPSFESPLSRKVKNKVSTI